MSCCALDRRDGTARLVVDDDGRGFDAADLDRRFAEGHIGLRSLGDLIDDSGGTLTVRSAPGSGHPGRDRGARSR